MLTEKIKMLVEQGESSLRRVGQFTDLGRERFQREVGTNDMLAIQRTSRKRNAIGLQEIEQVGLEELANYKTAKIYNLSDYFEEEFFDTKKVVHLPMKYKG